MAGQQLNPELIERLRRRAHDPERRNDANSTLSQTTSMDAILDKLGSKGDQLRSIKNQLQNLIGRTGPQLDSLRVATAMPVDDPIRSLFDPLPGPATTQEVAECEKTIGRSLPSVLMQLYMDIANGGFGPGSGLFSLKRIADEYREMTGVSAGPRNQPWPAKLLPLVDAEPGFHCLDIGSGEMVGWDPQEIEGYSNAAWLRSFKPLAPSLGAWLEAWLDRQSPGDLMAAVREKDKREAKDGALRAILDYYEKNPAERAKDGLPEAGWEDEVRRRHPGLGL